MGVRLSMLVPEQPGIPSTSSGHRLAEITRAIADVGGNIIPIMLN